MRSFAPSGPFIRSRIGPSSGSKSNSKVKNGQHSRSLATNLASFVVNSALPGNVNS